MTMKHFIKLESKPYYGKKLKDHPIWGDLSDFWKIYLDETHTADPRWRIIYTLLPDEKKPEIADVVIIGPREDDAVYIEVMSRLGRVIPVKPQPPSQASS